ncbi:hypothetical protein CPC08DRAFT_816514 [Agrocybe pediades]|nr:hypothetical protein CPC08DRAFT_816514 [Agrocybe pediades]
MSDGDCGIPWAKIKTRYEFLHTFYFKDLDLDLAKIVYNLPNLERLVGGHPNEQRLVEAFKQTRNRSLTTDIPRPHFRMYTFGTFGNSSLGLFAGFHSVSEILQDIHDAFIKPPPGSVEFLCKSLSEIILYLVDTPLKEEVHLIISGLMKIFIPTDLGMLTFIFEHPVETDPEEMKDILSLLPGLVRLDFHRFPSDKAPEHVDSSVREAQAKEYIKMSRRLRKIRFIDDYFYDQSREFLGQWE